MSKYPKNLYQVGDEEALLTPCLIYYEDLIRENTARIVQMAGGAERLWPHIKTHKSLDVTRLLMSYGIVKFKAATIAEAEMCAMAGAEKILLAYPLIGPNIRRLLQLSQAYPGSLFYGMEDDLTQFGLLSEAVLSARKAGSVPETFTLPVMIDVDLGLRRTGVPLEDLKDMIRRVSRMEGLELKGLHCYDGHRHEKDLDERDGKVLETDRIILRMIGEMREEGYPLPEIIAGGTPSFPCHEAHTDWYLSPGTSFIHDFGYNESFPDLGCTPAAAVAARVVSHPGPGMFTCDCGCKAIATDPAPERGRIAGMDEAVTVMQNEEHWVFRLPEGRKIPAIGEVLYILPTHICPTTALYPEILAVEKGQITKTWPVTARNRKINY